MAFAWTDLLLNSTPGPDFTDVVERLPSSIIKFVYVYGETPNFPSKSIVVEPREPNAYTTFYGKQMSEHGASSVGASSVGAHIIGSHIIGAHIIGAHIIGAGASSVGASSVGESAIGIAIDTRDYITPLLALIQPNYIVIGGGDLILVALLHAVHVKKLYYTTDTTLRRVINIDILRNRVQDLTGEYSTTGFKDALLVLTSTLLLGVPNFVSLQSSVNKSMIAMTLKNLSSARGQIVDFTLNRLNLAALFRFLLPLEKEEKNMTKEIATQLHHKGDSTMIPYDPDTSGMENYSEAYYCMCKMECSTKYITSYLVSWVELHKFLIGLQDFVQHSFVEAPLLYSVIKVLTPKCDTEWIDPTTSSFLKTGESVFNRWPHLK